MTLFVIELLFTQQRRYFTHLTIVLSRVNIDASRTTTRTRVRIISIISRCYELVSVRPPAKMVFGKLLHNGVGYWRAPVQLAALRPSSSLANRLPSSVSSLRNNHSASHDQNREEAFLKELEARKEKQFELHESIRGSESEQVGVSSAPRGRMSGCLLFSESFLHASRSKNNNDESVLLPGRNRVRRVVLIHYLCKQ